MKTVGDDYLEKISYFWHIKNDEFSILTTKLCFGNKVNIEERHFFKSLNVFYFQTYARGGIIDDRWVMINK